MASDCRKGVVVPEDSAVSCCVKKGCGQDSAGRGCETEPVSRAGLSPPADTSLAKAGSLSEPHFPPTHGPEFSFLPSQGCLLKGSNEFIDGKAFK